MSRLADPHFEEIFTLYKDIKTNFLDNRDEIDRVDLEPMLGHFRTLQSLINTLKVDIESYDSKTGTKANGYRSIIRVVATLVRHCSEVLETYRHQLSTLGYASNELKEDVGTWISVLERMIDILELTVELKSFNDKLYPDCPNSRAKEVTDLSAKAINLDLTPFYGSALGFHLRGDSRRMMHPLAISMASYSDVYGGSIHKHTQNISK